MLSRREFLCFTTCASAGLGFLGPGLRMAQGKECAPPPSDAPVMPFQPDRALPLRLRKSVYDLTDAEVERLRAAYAAMRQLAEKDPADPRGFFQQAGVHCWHCGAGVEIHNSWLFLPWHRAFLYFHERILGKLLGDPSFALPYWDWEEGPRRQLPLPYREPAEAGNPLYDAKRRKRLGGGVPRGNVGALAFQPIMALREFMEFGGTEGQWGKLEIGPHAGVHLWVGGGQADMGIFGTAARDPVFYAHHAQIDRLWHEWLRAGNVNPTESRWLDQRWTFYDEERRLVSIAVRDLLAPESDLRYAYASAAQRLAPAAPRIPPRKTPASPPAAPACPAPLGLTFPGLQLLEGERPVTIALSVPPSCRVEAVRIEGIQLPPTESILVRIFGNLPAATVATDVEAVAAHFLGYFCIVAQIERDAEASHRHPWRPISLSFGEEEQLARLLAKSSKKGMLQVTLVPVPDEEAPPRRSALRWERMLLLGRPV